MGPGNNLGIAKSKTQYVYVLNPDVLLNKDTFSKKNIHVEFMNNIVTQKYFQPNNKNDFIGDISAIDFILNSDNVIKNIK